MKLSWKGAAGLVAGGVVLGLTGSGAAQTATRPGSPSPEGKPPAFAHSAFGGEHGFGGPAIRSESVLPGVDGGPARTVRTDSGRLKAIDGSALAIDELDGTSVKVP